MTQKRFSNDTMIISVQFRTDPQNSSSWIKWGQKVIFCLNNPTYEWRKNARRVLGTIFFIKKYILSFFLRNSHFRGSLFSRPLTLSTIIRNYRLSETEYSKLKVEIFILYLKCFSTNHQEIKFKEKYTCPLTYIASSYLFCLQPIPLKLKNMCSNQISSPKADQ